MTQDTRLQKILDEHKQWLQDQEVYIADIDRKKALLLQELEDLKHTDIDQVVNSYFESMRTK